MANRLVIEAIQDAVKSSSKGRRNVPAKVIPKYPMSMEREYIRIATGYLRLVNQVVSEFMPQIKAAYFAEKERNRRHDSLNDVLSAVLAVFPLMNRALDEKTKQFDLYGKLKKLAAQTQKLSIREWKRVVQATLGIDLRDDVFSGELYERMLDLWVDSNVSLIKTIPADSLTGMQGIIQNGFVEGKPITRIVEEIQAQYGVDRRHARLIARDQMAKLNSNITQQQHRDAGCSRYRWRTTGDGKVRDGHKVLDKKEFSWDTPPVVDKRTGRRCHPGQDYQCRCIAIPIFDFDM